MKEINFNHKFKIEILSDIATDSNRTFDLEILIDKYLPAEDDHITFNDYFIIQRNILALLGPLLGKKITLGVVTYRPKAHIPFNNEELILNCKIMITKKLQFHYATLEFKLDNELIFQTEEFLTIEV